MVSDGWYPKAIYCSLARKLGPFLALRRNTWVLFEMTGWTRRKLRSKQLEALIMTS